MKLDRAKVFFIHFIELIWLISSYVTFRNDNFIPHALRSIKLPTFIKVPLYQTSHSRFASWKKKIKIKPSADEIWSRPNLSSFLFEIYSRLFKQNREIKTKGKLSCLRMRRKGIIKKRNILPGKSDSSGSIITPSLVKTPFRCYVPLFSFFFFFLASAEHQKPDFTMVIKVPFL